MNLRLIERIAMITVVAIVAVYAGDYLSLRFQIPNRPQFTVMPVKDFLAVKLKNGKTEFMPGDADTFTCVNSLFPQMGYAPCWYTGKKTQKIIDVK